MQSAAEARRAQLREEARKAQELLAKLQKEEEELEKKLQDEKLSAGKAAPTASSEKKTAASGAEPVKTERQIAIELQRKRQEELDAFNEMRRAKREARTAGSYGLSSPAPRSAYPVRTLPEFVAQGICRVPRYGQLTI